MQRAVVLLVVVLASLALAGCSGAGPSPLPSVSPSSVDLPPVWVQNEAMWQSLAAGEPHPRTCQWLETSAARAARLAGSATSYLGRGWPGKVYVVVLRGHFTPDQGQAGSAAVLYFVFAAQSHEYLTRGSQGSSLDLAPLGRVHTYVPAPLVHSGLWGHTMAEGGPYPGGPWPMARVTVWKGTRPAGQPLRHVRSDGNGFFSLDLAPGVYTLKLDVADQGGPVPVTVTVATGRTVAAGVYAVRA